MLRNMYAAGFSHPDVKLARQLMRGKSRDDLFAVEGTWGIERLLRAEIAIEALLVCCETLHGQESVWVPIAKRAQRVLQISERICADLTDRDAAEGCFIICRYPQHRLADMMWPENALLVILDGLEKPGNIGTIMRTTEGAGGAAVLAIHRKVALTHQRLIRASLGAAWSIPVYDLPYEQLIPYLIEQRFTVVLTDLTAARPYYDVDYSGRIAIVAGNENDGISASWRELNGLPVERVIVPMFGECESLNVGSATTIVAFEAGLQQKGFLTRSVVDASAAKKKAHDHALFSGYS